MAQWQTILDFKAIHNKVDKHLITPTEYATLVLPKLEKHQLIEEDYELQDVVEEFHDLSNDDSVTWDEIDDALESLYNWADRDHKCWIKTF